MRFSAVVGQDDLKLALLLAAVDPGIGGVLLRGEKGSGKTTLARALADLLPGDAPFVELPLGATEDRVLGSIDLGAALGGEGEQVRSGLLAAAHGGVLFVDEVNLLADHLVDTLLDVAASGVHRLERDGISVAQPARFVLVGTMNPEEGELRPQLLDRFGLCVDVTAPVDPDVRAEIVRRRLALDLGSGGDGPVPPERSGGRFEADDDRLRARLAATRSATIGDDVVGFATRLAVEVGAEGLRADLVLCRAAAALAGWEGRDGVEAGDVGRVAPLVLAHRSRRHPFDPPGIDPDDLAHALDRARPPHPAAADDGDADPGTDGPAPPDGPQGTDSPHGTDATDGPHGTDSTDSTDGTHGTAGTQGTDSPHGTDEDAEGGPTPPRPVAIGAERAAPTGPRGVIADGRGRVVRHHPWEAGTDRPISVVGTVRALARRRGTDPTAVAGPGDLRTSELVRRAEALVVICLDTSGSMGATERIELATGTVLGVLTDAYQRRHRVALVTFGGDGATTALSPTSSVEVVRNRLGALATGGPTPLAEGIVHATRLAVTARRPEEEAVLVLITDGRTSGGAAAFDQALTACDAVRRAAITPVVVDTETASPRLGLAGQLAERLGTTTRTDPFTRSHP